MQLYPGWSARDNYATRTKKKKIKRDVTGMTTNYETKLGIYVLWRYFNCTQRANLSVTRKRSKLTKMTF